MATKSQEQVRVFPFTSLGRALNFQTKYGGCVRTSYWKGVLRWVVML